jgi:hypothetical protein
VAKFFEEQFPMNNPASCNTMAVSEKIYHLAIEAFNQDSEALQKLKRLAAEGDVEAEHCLFHPEKLFDPCLHMLR